MNIRDAALALYGKGSAAAMIKFLARDLSMSESGVRKYWFSQREPGGPTYELLNLMLVCKNSGPAGEMILEKAREPVWTDPQVG